MERTGAQNWQGLVVEYSGNHKDMSEKLGYFLTDEMLDGSRIPGAIVEVDRESGAKEISWHCKKFTILIFIKAHIIAHAG